jgi:hypothetical protein
MDGTSVTRNPESDTCQGQPDLAPRRRINKPRVAIRIGRDARPVHSSNQESNLAPSWHALYSRAAYVLNLNSRSGACITRNSGRAGFDAVEQANRLEVI